MIYIVMPCWNHCDKTRLAVESIARNSYPYPVRFIFVDDYSSDGTRAYLTGLNPHRLIRNPQNLGVTKSWNAGLGAALECSNDSDIIALLNNDILVCPGWLEPVAKNVHKDKTYYMGRAGIPRRSGLTKRDFRQMMSAIAELEQDANRIREQDRDKKQPGRQGWSLFFTPEQVRIFHPIPDQFIFWFNDDYIHETLAKNGYRGEVLMDCCIFHWESISVMTHGGFHAQVEKDKEEWRKFNQPDP